MVAVPEDHPLHPLPVHFGEFRPAGHVFRSMGLVTRLVDDVEAVLVGQVQVFVHGRIVRGPDRVEIELLEDFHVAADDLLGHRVSKRGMLHVGAFGAHFHGLPVQVEDAVADLGLLEADPLVHLVHDLSGCIREDEVQPV